MKDTERYQIIQKVQRGSVKNSTKSYRKLIVAAVSNYIEILVRNGTEPRHIIWKF